MSQLFSNSCFKGKFNPSNGRVTLNKKGKGKFMGGAEWLVGTYAYRKRIFKLKEQLKRRGIEY